MRSQLSSAAVTMAWAPRRGKERDLRACFQGLGKVEATRGPCWFVPWSHSSMNLLRMASAMEEDSEVSTRETPFCSSFSYTFCVIGGGRERCDDVLVKRKRLWT